MEEKTFQIERLNNGNDWYVLTLDGYGQIIHSQIIGPDKKEAMKALKAAQSDYNQEQALAELRVILPEDSTVTIVLKHVNRHDNRYSVFASYQGKVRLLDHLIDKADIANYVYSKNQPNGVDFYAAGNLLTAMSSALWNSSRALKMEEIL